MVKPPLHEEEKERLHELYSFDIANDNTDEALDNLVTIAAEISDKPVILITLIDKDYQWIKAKRGIKLKGTPRDHSFCAYNLSTPAQPMIIEDARKDERFADNPLTQGGHPIIFYAGFPLLTKNNYIIGSLCIIDSKPGQLSRSKTGALKLLAGQVMHLLEERRTNKALRESQEALIRKNKDLEDFSLVAAHDLKSPLKNIEALVDLLPSSEENKEVLNNIRKSSLDLQSMIEGLLDYSRADNLLYEKHERINFYTLLDKIKGLMDVASETEFEYSTEVEEFVANRTAIEQILRNLVGNALKYNDKKQPFIRVSLSQCSGYYQICVADNGPGVKDAIKDKIFDLFNVQSARDRYGNRGSGIGLATVKKLVKRLGGEISVKSKVGEGATFCFTIKK